ncbi:MAG TPA: hypothetical protein VGR19_09630 [Allosphingosinicella sp.]|nr:hypothetical protein [Allosphingosinicella sp.]
MKKYLLAAAAVAAIGSAAPASAQVGDIIQQGLQGIFGGGGLNNRLATLESQIRISFQRGEISQNEASRLQGELIQLRQLERSFRADGLSRSERFELQQRLQMLEGRIQEARLGRGGRFDDDRRFGRNDDGRFGRNDDGRRFGRNDCPPGLAKKNNGCMPPGQAKKGDRSNGQFGDMWSDRGFRDNDRFIFRQDGNRILQIDRRTGQVVRVINRR